MPKKKEENLLGLSVVSDIPPPSTGLVPFGGREMRRDEKRIVDELRKQAMVIAGTEQKTVFGQTKICEMAVHGSVAFEQAVSSIVGVRDQARGTDYQTYVDQFTARQIESLARHLLGVTEIGATGIANEINRSLYPPPEQRGFLQRLFGE